MAQAGMHGLIGLAVRRWVPDREWLMLGIVPGNLLPDADNLAVAVATIAKLPADGLHPTFSHSLFKGLMTIYGVVYLLSLALAISLTIRMRRTMEAVTF